MEDDSQVPVAQAITEKEKMTFAQLGGQCDGQKVGDVGTGQIVDVVVFRNHEGIPEGTGPVDRAVDFQDDGSLIEG